jgi:aspartate kinase
MKVFKFGGASVKDANAVKNVAKILSEYKNEKIVVVVSAMAKTTNALENIVTAFVNHKPEKENLFKLIEAFHFEVTNELFEDKQHKVFEALHNAFTELQWAIDEEPVYDYNKTYDQIVCTGEIFSSIILANYLSSQGLDCEWQDARNFIKTDDTYREGNVIWDETETLLKKLNQQNNHSIQLFQGFIGGNDENFSVSLGREGSDYTASILAYCLDAESVTIWKDVPGVLSADPKFFPDAELIKHINYYDAIELTYYGASVIHPKTIKPLQNKNIPLHVRSFIDYKNEGTIIDAEKDTLPIPCYIFKDEQLLISIQPKDFSFIAEDNMSHVYNLFAHHRVKMNTVQNSALSMSVCCDNDAQKIPALIVSLQHNFKVLFNEGLKLYTIRHYNDAIVKKLSATGEVLLEVKSRQTCQFVIK